LQSDTQTVQTSLATTSTTNSNFNEGLLSLFIKNSAFHQYINILRHKDKILPGFNSIMTHMSSWIILNVTIIG